MNKADTKMSPVLSSQATACQPEPPATIADCSDLMSHPCFDVTALVKKVCMYRAVKDIRVVFDVEIIDGSKCSVKVRTMPLSVFCSRPS